MTAKMVRFGELVFDPDKVVAYLEGSAMTFNPGLESVRIPTGHSSVSSWLEGLPEPFQLSGNDVEDFLGLMVATRTVRDVKDWITPTLHRVASD
jgi:hypothetical protein